MTYINCQKQFQCFLLSLLVLLGGRPITLLAEERQWTRSEILAVADAKARELGYDVEQMGVSFDAYNSKWNDYLKYLGKADRDIDERLSQPYLAVYYAPLTMMVGGDLWVFIDQNTGKPIYHLAGQ